MGIVSIEAMFPVQIKSGFNWFPKFMGYDS